MSHEESDTYDGGNQTRKGDGSAPDRRSVNRDSWFDSKMIRIIGVIYGIALLPATWITVSIYTHNTQLAILDLEVKGVKERLATTTEIYKKLDDLNATIGKIQIDIATIKAKGGIP